MATPLLARWCRPAYAMAAGLATAAVGAAMIAGFAGAENTPMLVVGTVVLYLGIAPVDHAWRRM